MPLIPAPEVQGKRFISDDPDEGVVAVLNSDDEAVVNLIARSQTTGDVIHSAPPNSEGTNTRRHLFDRPIVSTSTVTADKFIGDLEGTFEGTAATATALETPRIIFGQSFDGTANVAGALTATTIAASDGVAIASGQRFYLDGVAGTGDTSIRESASNRIMLASGGSDVLGVDVVSGVFVLNTGFQVGSPTGGNKGVGNINVSQDVFKNNTAYTNPDYVFEKWATGRITKYADRDGAASYPGIIALPELEAYVRQHHHFPRIPRKALGAFSRADVLLELVEESYIHLFGLEARLARLENQKKPT